MALDICVDVASLHGTYAVNGLPWDCALQHADLHLEPEESRHHAQFPRVGGLSGALPALGTPYVSIDNARIST